MTLLPLEPPAPPEYDPTPELAWYLESTDGFDDWATPDELETTLQLYIRDGCTFTATLYVA